MTYRVKRNGRSQRNRKPRTTDDEKCLVRSSTGIDRPVFV